MQKLRLHGNQKGFTLVEIAIVLVIIGLLIGGILKGQEMIQNAKIKRVQKQADEIRAAMNSYQDRYGALPGDDSAPTAHTGVAGLTAGNNNGQINGTGPANAEALYMCRHLAAANLISGTPTMASCPQNTFGGGAFVQWTTYGGITANWITFTQIPAEVARVIDTSMDDGANGTGTVQASAAYINGTTVTTYIRL